MALEHAMDELLPFLSVSTRSDLRAVAVESFLGLTTSSDGQALIRSRCDVISKLVQLSSDREPVILNGVIRSIVNLSADDEEMSLKLVSTGDSCLVSALVHLIVNKDGGNDEITEVTCMALANLSRPPQCCQIVWDKIRVGIIPLESIITLLCTESGSFDYLGMVFCNLSQLASFRRELLNGKNAKLIRKLLPLVNYKKSGLRRQGIAGMIRNCCFDTESHDWLLSDEIAILTTLVYPVAGPEEFDEDEMDKLPLELQYLGDEKERESDPKIRLMLIEAVNQLCAKKNGREMIRRKNVYYIYRELHKWEPVKEVKIACENLVDILIGDEPEAEFENLKEIEVPCDLQEKFHKMDADLLTDD